MITVLTNENYEQEVLQAKGTVLVDFYSDRCGPCLMQAPIIEELSEELTDVKFCKLNTDEAVEIAIRNRIFSIPTIMIVEDGEITFKEAGLMMKYELEKLLRK